MLPRAAGIIGRRERLSHFTHPYLSMRRFGDAVNLEDDIIITKACANRIKALSNNKGNYGLRLSVEGGGCSGFKYVFKMEDLTLASPDDKLFKRDDSCVLIDAASLDLVKGATIDYKQEMIRSSFVISNNPQSENACGCGSSFAVKNFATNPAID